MSLVGRNIGRYRILEQIGQGGMSVVYKGFDSTLDREVAVKVLHPHLATKTESLRRLRQEAKAVARLKHPNILEVFDYADENTDEAYLVTEYIRGRTLREFLGSESLAPPEIAAMVIHEIAAALAHAHDAGVIHRDLKPENVMVRDDGVLKLMDFGIAKVLDREEKMTLTGALVGSPAHMAPEIIEGEEATVAADVFSLGTMLYLFSTGKLPFTATNTTATLKRIVDCVYDDPRQLVSTISDDLADIIHTCLARSPTQRYDGAGKLRDALFAYLTKLALVAPSDELRSFFADPRSYRTQLVERLVLRRLSQVDELVAQQKTAAALSLLNLILANDPQNERALACLKRISASKNAAARRRRRMQVFLFLGTAVAVAGVVLKLVDFLAHREVKVDPPMVQSPFAKQASEPEPQLPTDDLQPTPSLIQKKVEPVKKTVVTPKVAIQRSSDQAFEVAVIIRPFGWLQVDRSPRSQEALARHIVRLTPGVHQFRVTCEWCETQGKVVTREVKSADDILLVAPLRPSLVSFQGYPSDATVRIGTEEKRIDDSQKDPFVVVTPAAGSVEMRHRVDFEVRQGTSLIDRGTRWVQPGQPALISKGP